MLILALAVHRSEKEMTEMRMIGTVQSWQINLGGQDTTTDYSRVLMQCIVQSSHQTLSMHINDRMGEREEHWNEMVRIMELWWWCALRFNSRMINGPLVTAPWQIYWAPFISLRWAESLLLYRCNVVFSFHPFYVHFNATCSAPKKGNEINVTMFLVPRLLLLDIDGCKKLNSKWIWELVWLRFVSSYHGNLSIPFVILFSWTYSLDFGVSF